MIIYDLIGICVHQFEVFFEILNSKINPKKGNLQMGQLTQIESNIELTFS